MLIASSQLETVSTGSTGPKISSVISVLSWMPWEAPHGWGKTWKNPWVSGKHPWFFGENHGLLMQNVLSSNLLM